MVDDGDHEVADRLRAAQDQRQVGQRGQLARAAQLGLAGLDPLEGLAHCAANAVSTSTSAASSAGGSVQPTLSSRSAGRRSPAGRRLGLPPVACDERGQLRGEGLAAARSGSSTRSPVRAATLTG